MRTKILIALAVILPAQAFAATDYYLKLDGVEGESSSSAPAPTRTRLVAEPEDSREDEEDELELEAEDDDDGEEAEGKVEMEWKVEEGESATPDEDEVDADSDDEPITPDFSILLGGNDDEGDEDDEEAREKAAEILREGLEDDDLPAESVSLNFEKIETKLRQEVRLFGFIPLSAPVTVEIDAEERVTVKFPWWAFLASGKDESLGEKVFSSISNVLKTKHDALKNAIGNIR